MKGIIINIDILLTCIDKAERPINALHIKIMI